MKTNHLLAALIPLLTFGCDHNSQSQGAQSSDKGDSGSASMSSYETNHDSELSQSEFDVAVTEAGYFSDWDADGDQVVDTDEYRF